MPTALSCLRMPLSRVAVASLTAVGITPLVLAAALPGALEKMLVDDSVRTLQLRTCAMDRHQPGPVLNEAWAAGGCLDYCSGWLGDMLGIALVGFTSQPLWDPSDAAAVLESAGHSRRGTRLQTPWLLRGSGQVVHQPA